MSFTALFFRRQSEPRVIEIVHLVGAHDSYIARQFLFHALRLGLRRADNAFRG